MCYTNITRYYIRGEYPYANNEYEQSLLQHYEKVYYPPSVAKSGKLCYIKRNEYMIDNSDICVFYYNKNYLPQIKSKSNLLRHTNSGTSLAYYYASKKHKTTYNLFK